ncbi:MAG: rhomboid family intramembrane serine protease, partial [Planctomycetes bacterium]|nr:rhomboid family intramembrane serine protease [Planctomycetota bacterium]
MSICGMSAPRQQPTRDTCSRGCSELSSQELTAMSSLVEAAKRKLKLKSTLVFVGTVWAIHLLNIVLSLPMIDFPLDAFGLRPRTLAGLPGIVTMPLLHASLGHLIGNTIPLLVLLVLLAGSRERSWDIVTGIILLGGGLLWLVGRDHVHVGASGLISGLVAFLVLRGVFEKRLAAVLVAVVTFLL